MFKSMECQLYNKTVAKQFECFLSEYKNNTILGVNVNLELKHNVKAVTLYLTTYNFRGKKPEKFFNFQNIDICLLFKEGSSHYFLREFTEKILDNSNFPLGCPFLKVKLFVICGT